MQIVMKYLPGISQILENKMRHILPPFWKYGGYWMSAMLNSMYNLDSHCLNNTSYLQFQLRKFTFASSVSKYLVLLKQLMTRIRVWWGAGVGWGALVGWTVVKLTLQFMVWCNIHVKILYKHCFSSYLVNSLQCRLCPYRQVTVYWLIQLTFVLFSFKGIYLTVRPVRIEIQPMRSQDQY